MKKTWTLDVKQHEDGDFFIEFPDEVLEGAGWRTGDRIEWIDNKDGSWTLKKRETQLVLVECISQFRQRYVVEVPIGVDDFGNDKANWALDTVTMEEAQEFSQEHLGETIVSHRVVTPEEVLKLCDKDNSYCSSWTDEHKMDTFVTKWKEDDVT
jgi:bifunctional DNA-binding transcriptional regulator/antitoxin component of YhaV-PrlF toxin-antitoxin module